MAVQQSHFFKYQFLETYVHHYRALGAWALPWLQLPTHWKIGDAQAPITILQWFLDYHYNNGFNKEKSLFQWFQDYNCDLRMLQRIKPLYTLRHQLETYFMPMFVYNWLQLVRAPWRFQEWCSTLARPSLLSLKQTWNRQKVVEHHSCKLHAWSTLVSGILQNRRPHIFKFGWCLLLAKTGKLFRNLKLRLRHASPERLDQVGNCCFANLGGI